MRDGLLLLMSAIAGGMIAFLIPGSREVAGKRYRLALVFSGAYLFAITVTHILPDLMNHESGAPLTGVLILTGFFFQQILEFFTGGVEHGHLHIHHKGESHKTSTAVLVVTALGIHAFMEGGMLANAGRGETTVPQSLLYGVLMHKLPETFALVSVLSCELPHKKAVIFMILFSLASPAGLWAGDFLFGNAMLSEQFFHGLFALVCGSFLHISTTIVFESNANHHFNFRKLAVAILGSLTALAADFIF